MCIDGKANRGSVACGVGVGELRGGDDERCGFNGEDECGMWVLVLGERYESIV